VGVYIWGAVFFALVHISHVAASGWSYSPLGESLSLAFGGSFLTLASRFHGTFLVRQIRSKLSKENRACKLAFTQHDWPLFRRPKTTIAQHTRKKQIKLLGSYL
jgi:hypothetical protein